MAYKTIEIWSLPNILTVHLKRFKNEGNSLYSRSKNDRAVEMQTECDLSRFVLSKEDKTNNKFEL